MNPSQEVKKSVRKRKKRLTAKQKGKQKARSVSSGGEEEVSDSNDDGTGDEDGAEEPSRCVPGPLSREALEEVRKLGERTMADAEALAHKYGKNTRSIMIAAGLGVQHSRHAANFSNKFKVWYAHKHPKPEDSMCASNYWHLGYLTESSVQCLFQVMSHFCTLGIGRFKQSTRRIRTITRRHASRSSTIANP